MFRCLALAVAFIALQVVDPAWPESSYGPAIGIQQTTLIKLLKWSLAAWLAVEVNTTLNGWAENRWRWNTNNSDWNWPTEVAVVTGGSAGIGACVVKQLVSHRIKVAVLDIGPLSNQFTDGKTRQLHCWRRSDANRSAAERDLIRYYRCNIASRDDIRNAAEAVRADLGPPSILINNAGIGNAYSILDIPPKALRNMFDINLISHWGTVQEFLPDMIVKKKGHIISVASLASFVALAGAVDYSATKAALLAFHEGLNQELKHRYKCPQVKTTIVHPGWTKSAITSHEAIRAGLKQVGASLLEPEDVANAMVKQIISAKSGQIVLGPGITPKIRAFPMWLQEIVRDSQANVVFGNGSTATK
jgi:all-trans-retinol dehydrogenase (NAD+)